MESKEQIFEAKMSFGDGHIWLPVVKRISRNGKEEVVFCREDGVHAWHCNSLPIDDYRVLEVRIKNI